MVMSWNLDLMSKTPISLFYSKAFTSFAMSHSTSKVEGGVASQVIQLDGVQLSILSDSSPWWVKPELPKQGMWAYLPNSSLGGFVDGPIAAGVGSEVKLYVARSEAFRVSFSSESLLSAPGFSINQVWDSRFFGANIVKKSYLLSNSRHYELDVIGDASPDFALLLIYLRIAYPLASIGLSSLPGENKPLWRRLSQNLGILSGRDPRPSKETWSTLGLKENPYHQGATQKHIEELMSYAPVIPEKLFRFWIGESALESFDADHSPSFHK